MREILFRGKSENTDMWVYGKLFESVASSFIIRNNNIIDLVQVNQDTIGQYTGIKDINGVKIYEGDILKCLDTDGDNYLSLVRYDDGAFTIDVNYCDYDYTAIGWALSVDVDDVEVIGNVHDNPELLKGDEK